MRKQIVRTPSPPAVLSSRHDVDVATLATVLVSSETPEFPVDNVFDGHYGPGGTRWIAAEPGEQVLTVAFDTPQLLQGIVLEVEEREVERTQELSVALSADGGQTYRELLRQEYTFSPAGATFEREEWTVPSQEVTHVRLRIKPDKGGRPCRAALTTLALH
jgi:hypothetical protein